ncbi:MAG: porin [Candidatus Eisenbacteria bacterium]
MRKTVSLLCSIAACSAVAVPAAHAEGTTLSGFVDASYFGEFSGDNGEFGLDQVEIDVEHEATEKAGLRADLEWVKDGEEYIAQVEQAYATYAPAPDWTLTFGKFNAPIGFELLDPTDVYQFSHSLVFDYGLPTNLTGLSVARTFGNGFDVIAHVSNGWDRQTASRNVTVGGRAGFAQDALTLGVSAISGKEDLGEETYATLKRTVVDVDASYALERVLFGGEFNLGSAEHNGFDADWTGFLLMAHATVNELLGITARVDWFDDPDGYVFGYVFTDASESGETRQSFTLSPTLYLGGGVGALLELRMDKSDRDVFLDSDGEPTDTSMSGAFEVTYGW